MNKVKALALIMVIGGSILSCMADNNCDGTSPANCVIFLRQQYPPTCNYTWNGYNPVCINIRDGDTSISCCNSGSVGVCMQSGTVTCNYSWTITDANTGQLLDSGPGQTNPPTFQCAAW